MDTFAKVRQMGFVDGHRDCQLSCRDSHNGTVAVGGEPLKAPISAVIAGATGRCCWLLGLLNND